MQKVNFQKADSALTLTSKTELKAFIESLFKKEKTPLATINYIFCSDEYLLSINQQFLKHDYYTDIITFGLHDKGTPVVAEVYISTDRVKDNAANHGVTYTNEMLRVLFHGALHLCGYKDKSKVDILTIRAKEDAYLKRYTKK
ncbi:MAG: rRNA maturation RNase YbeY [Bacteroidota bacterium]|jgi:probable rRNA maturation factor